MRQSQVYRLCLSASAGVMLLACQMQAPVALQQTARPVALSQGPLPQLSLQARAGGAGQSEALQKLNMPVGQVQVTPTPGKPGKANVSVSLQLPQEMAASPESQRGGFRTQAIGQFGGSLQASIIGTGLSVPIYPDDSNEGIIQLPVYQSYNNTWVTTLHFSDVPYGAVRLLQVNFGSVDGTTFNARPGADIESGFALNSDTAEIEISFRTTPMGKILRHLLLWHQTHGTGSAAQYEVLLSKINLTALQALIDNLTVPNASPPTDYQTHPTLINTEAIAADLIAQQGNVGSLSAANPAYKQPSSLSFTVSGLQGNDQAAIVVWDPATKTSWDTGIYYGNGTHTLTGITPGTWNVEIYPHYVDEPRAVDYIPPLAFEHTFVADQITDIGELALTINPFPVILDVLPYSVKVGNEITIHGLNFSPNPSVRFDNTPGEHNGVEAQIISASDTEITVTVPNVASGFLSVKVGEMVGENKYVILTPDITLSSLEEGATVSGNVTLAADILTTDNIVKVEYFSNGYSLGESTTAPYTLTLDWNTTGWPGNQAITAVVTINHPLGEIPYSSDPVNVTVIAAPSIQNVSSSINPLYANHLTELSCAATGGDGQPVIGWSSVGNHGIFEAPPAGPETLWRAPATAGEYTLRCSASDGTNTTTQDLVLTVLAGEGDVSGSGGLF